MPGQPHDAAWALRQMQRNERPMRTCHVTLAQGLDERAWVDWPMEQRAAVLEPYVREGEHVHWSNDGEAFIVHDTMPAPRSEVSGTSLEQLQEDRRVRVLFDPVLREEVAAARRDMASQVWGQATAEFAPKYVQVLELVLDKALGPDSTEADRRLAAQTVQKELDRWMGKSVAAVQDVSTGKASAGSARDLMRRGKQRALPASSNWTPESIAEDARAEIEAGVIDVDDETGE